MAAKENKILPFATNIESNDILTDEEYETDVTRTGGNIIGIAKRRPNNKALKQATLLASALAQLIANGSKADGSADDGYDVNDTITFEQMETNLRNVLVGIIEDTAGSDNTLVHIANNETITGNKTFSKKIIANGGVQLPSNAPAGVNDAARKGYIDDRFTLLPIKATTADANGFTTPQRLACPSTVANLPVAKVGFMDIYKAKGDNDIIQVYYLNDNSAIYARTSENGGSTWSEWKLQTLSDLSAYVKTVNNVAPDDNGNVNIEINVDTSNLAKLNANNIFTGVKQAVAHPITKGSTGTASDRSIRFIDNQGDTKYAANGFGTILNRVYSNGDVETGMYAHKNDPSQNINSYIGIKYPMDGEPYATAPTPANSATGEEIITAKWARANLVEDSRLFSLTKADDLNYSAANATGIPDRSVLAFWNGAYNANNASNLLYCKNGQIVGTGGSQTIVGTKTFSAVPVCSTAPTANNHIANKEYVDGKVPAIASQSEAEAGTNNTKMMTPLRVKQAINNLIENGEIPGLPDFSASISISNVASYTIPSPGYFILESIALPTGNTQKSVYLKYGGGQIALGYSSRSGSSSSGYYSDVNIIIPIIPADKNLIINGETTFKGTFIPMKTI